MITRFRVVSRAGNKMNDKEGLLDHKRREYSPEPVEHALFHEAGKSPKERLVLFLFIAFVVSMVLITVILSIYRGTVVDSTYILLGVSIISIAMVQVVMVVWARTGELPPEKMWFLYFVGICIVLESVLTNVLLYHRPH